MRFSELPKKQKAVAVAALCVAILMLALFIIDFSGLCKGISDIFPLLLGILLVLVAILRKSKKELGMTRFYLICGILMIILYVAEQILIFIYR